MNANIVNILSWSEPPRTALALFSLNLILWILLRQRPFCVLPLLIVVWYCRKLWRYRIRPEVLIDPPDHEEWINLSTYELHLGGWNFLADLFNRWLSFRTSNHLMWTIGTCTGWIILSKIGMELDLLTLLFFITNAAFFIYPLLEAAPKIVDTSQYHHPPTIAPPPPPAPHSPNASLPLLDLYEGIVTRSRAAAISLMSSSSSSSPLPPASASPSPEPSSSSYSSLSPSINQMPGVEEVGGGSGGAIGDSEPEDEFLFDAKHFDKSSSSSVSNSFEIIDEL